ncbi:MAG: SGNH/GDSL hydrolase family protein, partial [Planctomycetota bacterium]
MAIKNILFDFVRKYRKLSVVIGSFLFCFIVSEIICRLSYNPASFYTYHPSLFKTLRPNARGIYDFEGYARVRINAQGLRDHEYDYEKKKGVFRIAVLGDSFTESLPVPLEKTFVKLLEKKLNSGGRETEVINFGCSDYGTAQEYLMWREESKKYQPDLVILAFCTINDIRNNHRAFYQDNRPFFRLQPDGSLAESSEIPSPGVIRNLKNQITGFSYFMHFLASKKMQIVV